MLGDCVGIEECGREVACCVRCYLRCGVGENNGMFVGCRSKKSSAELVLVTLSSRLKDGEAARKRCNSRLREAPSVNTGSREYVFWLRGY